MTKNTYLQEIKDGLKIFEESYQQQEILKLDEKIDQLIQSGMTEEASLKSLGTKEEIISSIYKLNHVNPNYVQKRSFWKEQYESLFQVINHVVEVMGKNSGKANVKIIFDIFLLIVLTCLLKIPFILIRDLGENLLNFLSNPFLVSIWQFLIEIIYLIVGVTFFFIIFKKWFKNLKIQK